MDPAIMKLLEEDEDESRHCGANVEAITAALSRDINGETSDSDGQLPYGSNSTSNLLVSQFWQNFSVEDVSCKNQQELIRLGPVVQPSSEQELLQQEIDSEKQQKQIVSSQENSQDDKTGEHRKTEQNPLQIFDENRLQISKQNHGQQRKTEENPLQILDENRLQISKQNHGQQQKTSNSCSTASVTKSQTQDAQLRQVKLCQAMSSTHLEGTARPMNAISAPVKCEVQTSTN
ncbi:hypothetical protein GIB67_038861, partial [Kingdonia uniflora]